MRRKIYTGIDQIQGRRFLIQVFLVGSVHLVLDSSVLVAYLAITSTGS